MNLPSKYAAFVITYNREDILISTLQDVFSQSFPPDFILVIDNGNSSQLKNKLFNLFADKIDYFTIGENIGPAGGAYYGMKMLFDRNWDWLLWIDDDNPPPFKDSIATVFNIINLYKGNKPIGLIGAVGTLFNKHRAITVRIDDAHAKGVIEVDHVAGGMLPLIHRSVYEAGILPEPNLFFGFEELCFCLRMKRSGFAILINGDDLLRYRRNANKIGYKRPFFRTIQTDKIWRQYYSVRNLLHILVYEEKNLLSALYFTFKMSCKSIFVFSKGIHYGASYTKIILIGLIDGWRNNLPLRFIKK